MWKDDKTKRNKTHAYIETGKEFDAIDPLKVDYVFGEYCVTCKYVELCYGKFRIFGKTVEID